MRRSTSLPFPSPHAPFRTLGVLGAERTGMRLMRAATDLGIRVRELAAPAHVPASARLADPWRDPASYAPLAARCDVVTAVAEHVSAATLQAIGAYVPVRPAPGVAAIAHDRVLEKRWLDPLASVTAPWRLVETRGELATVVPALAGEAGCWIKPRHRRTVDVPPVHAADVDAALAAWERLGRVPCIVETALPVEHELVVLAARAPQGDPVTYPVAMVQRRGTRVLWSAMPAPIPDAVARKATRLAAYYANRLRVEGLLAVELFLLVDGRLAVNELVPGPHPAFDATEAACVTDQYEQCVRAVCDLPLGPVTLVAPTACARIERDRFALAWHAALRGGARGARVVPHDSQRRGAVDSDGHVTVSASTVEAAVERALATVDALLEHPGGIALRREPATA